MPTGLPQSMNKVVLVCHCLLNPLTRAQGTKPLRRDFIPVLITENIGLLQLPCPELIFGFVRAPCNKEDYDTPQYRSHCRNLAQQTAHTIEEYSKANFTTYGLISIGGSPSCGCQRTHVRGTHVREPGIFIEELQNVLQQRHILLNITDHELLTDKKSIRAFLGKNRQ
jgi:predicted secreted protein